MLGFVQLLVLLLLCSLLPLSSPSPASASPTNHRLLSEYRQIRETANSISYKSSALTKPPSPNQPPPTFVLSPLTKSLCVWQFTFCGPSNTPYARGLYTGRIHLPPTYPAAPPELYMLTPSGRWAVKRKICLSMTSHHPESWDVRWSLVSMVCGLQVRRGYRCDNARRCENAPL